MRRKLAAPSGRQRKPQQQGRRKSILSVTVVVAFVCVAVIVDRIDVSWSSPSLLGVTYALTSPQQSALKLRQCSPPSESILTIWRRNMGTTTRMPVTMASHRSYLVELQQRQQRQQQQWQKPSWPGWFPGIVTTRTALVRQPLARSTTSTTMQLHQALFSGEEYYDNDDDTKEEDRFPSGKFNSVNDTIGNQMPLLLPCRTTVGTISRMTTDDSDKETMVINSPVHVTLRKLQLQFTCQKCETRNTHKISRSAYRSGVVIVACQGSNCTAQHLIADHLGYTNLSLPVLHPEEKEHNHLCNNNNNNNNKQQQPTSGIAMEPGCFE